MNIKALGSVCFKWCKQVLSLKYQEERYFFAVCTWGSWGNEQVSTYFQFINTPQTLLFTQFPIYVIKRFPRYFH